MPRYITAYDPRIGKRAVHVLVGHYAVSLISGNKFKYDP